MRRRIGWWMTALAVIVPAAAIAASDPESDAANTDHRFPLGTRTRAYLERQRNGEEASNGHGLTPPAERRARKRYLQSFEHPIPDLFDMDDGKEKQ